MTLTQQQIAAIGGEGIIKPDDLPNLCHCERLIEQMLKTGEWLTIYDFQQPRRMRLTCSDECVRHSVTPRIWAYRVTKLEATA